MKIYQIIFLIQLRGMISEKGTYGLIAGVISTAVLQPFENIKIALMLPPKELENKFSRNFMWNGQQAYRYIIKNDGVNGLFKGMIAATLKAGMGSYIYFSILRHLEKEDQSAFKNFLTSSFARILSTFFTNPLSIVETRFQLADFHMYTSVHGAVADIYKKEGYKGFFSGALASCLKEGFFAGVYYMIYDELKDLGMAKFPSGIVSGMMATTLSHPLQIIRARLQTIGLTQRHELSEHLIWREIKMLQGSGEWFKGLAPRLIKKPLANTLTFLIFQLMEEVKEKNNKSS